MSHTPGPWKMIYVGGGDWDLQGPVTQEDWTLAAAAPDLLEALELADAMLSGANMNASVVERKVRAAIAKARGEK
jgi:hypothetical protein